MTVLRHSWKNTCRLKEHFKIKISFEKMLIFSSRFTGNWFSKQQPLARIEIEIEIIDVKKLKHQTSNSKNVCTCISNSNSNSNWNWKDERCRWKWPFGRALISRANCRDNFNVRSVVEILIISLSLDLALLKQKAFWNAPC